MKIQVRMRVAGKTVKEDHIEIADEKLIPLSQDEVEAAIELLIRQWVDKQVEIDWEAVDDEGVPISWEDLESWKDEE